MAIAISSENSLVVTKMTALVLHTVWFIIHFRFVVIQTNQCVHSPSHILIHLIAQMQN